VKFVKNIPSGMKASLIFAFDLTVSLQKLPKHKIELEIISLTSGNSAESSSSEIYFIESFLFQSRLGGDFTSYMEEYKLCLVRFAEDERMLEVYELLHDEFEGDGWLHFLWAISIARNNYRPYRDRARKAIEIAIEISSTADKLAKLLDKSMANGIMPPVEFFSLRDLLRRCPKLSPNFPLIRGYCLDVGDLTQGQIAEINLRQQQSVGWSGLLASDPRQSELDLFWNAFCSPPAKILEELAKSASEYSLGSELLFPVRRNSPSAAVILAAIKARQSNVKTEYFRAFSVGFASRAENKVTESLLKALAIISTVALDAHDVTVTPSEVRLFYQREDRKSKGGKKLMPREALN
jgi:hypothetical protein